MPLRRVLDIAEHTICFLGSLRIPFTYVIWSKIDKIHDFLTDYKPVAKCKNLADFGWNVVS